MDDAVKNVGTVYKDTDINKLAQKQFETTQVSIHCMYYLSYRNSSLV